MVGFPGCSCKICGSTAWTSVLRNVRDWEYGTPGVWDYLLCRDCEIIQIHPFPDIEQLIAAYPKDYQAFGDRESRDLVFRGLASILDGLSVRCWKKRVRPGDRVLDIGCGEGGLLDKLRKLGADPHGIDFSPHASAICRDRGHSVFEGTLSDFAIQSDSGLFDGIVMDGYLEHSIDPRRDLLLVRHLLKPDGWLEVQVPNFRAVDRVLFGRYWGGAHAPRHTFQFTDKTLRELLNQTGFDNVQLRSLPSPTCYALSVQNAFQKARVERGGRPRFARGRAPYYTALLLGFAPLHLACMPSKRVGLISVTASRRTTEAHAAVGGACP